MPLFSQIARSVNSILPRLFGDPDLATEITWRRFNASEWDNDAGINVETFDDFTITSIRIEKEVGSMRTNKFPPGAFMMSTGDLIFLFEAGDVPSGASIRDQIVEDGLAYGVKKIEPVFGLITKVEVKGYA